MSGSEESEEAFAESENLDTDEEPLGTKESEVRTYGIKEEVIREAVDVLQGKSYNTFLFPYLIYRKLSCEEMGCCNSYSQIDVFPTISPSREDLLDFFNRFIFVPGNKADEEYYRPWAPQARNQWTTEHAAGRLAHSTTDGKMPSTQGPSVAEAPEGSSGTYSYQLVDSHAEIAVEEFNNGAKFTFYPLACYLLRNFVIDSEEEPTREDIVNTFRTVFCFPKQENGSEHPEFKTLFDLDRDVIDEHPYEIIS